MLKVKFQVQCCHGDKVRSLRLPGHNIVCGRCYGTGKHTNPAIDSHGLTAEDMEDEDFAEGYRSGRFDVVCEACDGERVDGIVDLKRLPTPLRRRISQQLERQSNDNAERAFEMRMAASGMEW